MFAAGKPASQPASTASAETIILDTAGYWRAFATLAPPAVRQGAGVQPVEPRAPWLKGTLELPPAGWTKPDFDDSGWYRSASMPFAWNTEVERQWFSPFMALLLMRGKFAVTAPSAVKGLSLSMTYNGGVVVYLNGRELTRAHLGQAATCAPDALAQDYGDGEALDRKLQLDIPSSALRKGVNVLAIEAHRSAQRPQDVTTGKNFKIEQGLCGVRQVRLTAGSSEGIVPNLARPAGLQVWNSSLMATDFDMDWGDPNEPLTPVRIVAARNGAFSGKVVVGSTQPIRGLRVRTSDLSATGGAKIPSGAVEVRFGVADGNEMGAFRRYLANPLSFGALEGKAPAEVAVVSKKPARGYWANLQSPGVPLVGGAVTPVWITVHVPAGAPAGDYTGRVTVEADGAPAVVVPVALKICPWTLSDPHEFRTFADVVESPESVAMYYRVPLWSDKHFELLERSLKLLRNVGAKVVYIPLICQTNMGNEESMVRWNKQADGSCKHDFAIADRYLDLFVRCVGKPMIVCLYVSDYNTNGDFERVPGTDTSRHPDANTFVPVTGLDASGAVTTVHLPAYADPAAKALWKPLIEGFAQRLRQRGLEGAMMFGVSADFAASKATVNLFKELSPKTPWVSACHPTRTEIQGVPCGYSAGVWGASCAGASNKPLYGWKRPFLAVHFPRSLRPYFPPTTYRHLGEVNIGGDQRGFARLGADFWPVLKNRSGQVTGTISARYPTTSWRNLDVAVSMLAPGRDGPISTVNYEMLREGLQECEARIAIEAALSDEKLKARLGKDLADRCEAILRERTQYLRLCLSTMIFFGGWTQYGDIDNVWWQSPAQIGGQWYVCTQWQQRAEKLYTAAAEVANTLAQRPGP